MNQSRLIKRKIPTEKLQDFQIKMNGQEKCANGAVIINGIEFGIGVDRESHGKGIVGFELSLQANDKPEIIVHYNPHLATKVACEALGIEKRPSYPSYECTRKDGELVCELLHDGDMS